MNHNKINAKVLPTKSANDQDLRLPTILKKFQNIQNPKNLKTNKSIKSLINLQSIKILKNLQQ
jgi:hypothetical protein